MTIGLVTTDTPSLTRRTIVVWPVSAAVGVHGDNRATGSAEATGNRCERRIAVVQRVVSKTERPAHRTGNFTRRGSELREQLFERR